MATYAIGDIQGCYHELQQLLELCTFNKATDRLWFTGDLVNRGPQSLEVLRFVRSLSDRAITVLGNHDLHLLAVAQGVSHKAAHDDTLAPILTAPDRDELLAWLKSCPLMHHDPVLNYTLVHAGLPPQWDLNQAQQCASEVEDQLRTSNSAQFFPHIYGNEPTRWLPTLSGWARLRFIINCFTRLRFCSEHGVLCLEAKGPPGTQPQGYHPWFEIATRKSRELNVIFGHWSTLKLTLEEMNEQRAFGLDMGCLWGGSLTAMRLEDRKLFSVPASNTDRLAVKLRYR